MLKLEKIAKSLEVSITLSKRERLFNRAFLQALAIAVGLHLLAGMFFQVRPFMIMGSQIVFPPVIVDADVAPSSEAGITVQMENEEATPRLIREPKGSKLALPAIPLTKGYFAHTTVQAKETSDPFAALEERFFIEPVTHKEKPQPARVLVSGPLAQADFVPPPLAAIKTPSRNVYAVRVDAKTGTIFWYESLYSEGRESDQRSEEILKSLKFHMPDDALVVAGEVEILQ